MPEIFIAGEQLISAQTILSDRRLLLISALGGEGAAASRRWVSELHPKLTVSLRAKMTQSVWKRASQVQFSK